MQEKTGMQITASLDVIGIVSSAKGYIEKLK